MQKSKVCTKGYSCGLTCINRERSCSKELTGQSVQLCSQLADLIQAKTRQSPNYANRSDMVNELTELNKQPYEYFRHMHKRLLGEWVEGEGRDLPPKINKPIGQGAYGTVYLSKSGTAVKDLPRDSDVQDEIDMQQEAAGLGLAPKILSQGYTGNRRWFEMEYLEGYIPADALPNLDGDQKVLLNKRIDDAFEALDGIKINHYDTHGGNIMVNLATNDIKIIDFGNAYRSQEDKNAGYFI